MEQEEKLIRRIVRRGDRKAAGLLVERYYEEIFFLVARQNRGKPGNGDGCNPGNFCKHAPLPAGL